MNLLQTLLVSLRAVYRNRMRSFLTALGIIIGVGAVITMMAIGAGAKAQVEAAFAAMGNNLLVIQAGSSSTGGVRGGAGTQPTLTWDDLTAIRDEGPDRKTRGAVSAIVTDDFGRRPKLGDQRHRHQPRIFRHPQLARIERRDD